MPVLFLLSYSAEVQLQFTFLTGQLHKRSVTDQPYHDICFLHKPPDSPSDENWHVKRILGSTISTSALDSEIMREAIYLAGDSRKSSILGLKAKSHAGNNRFTVVLLYKLLASFHYFVGTPVGFIIVRLTGTLDELCLFRIVRDNKPRVYSNTVPSYSAARLEDVHTRMFVGQLYQLPYIDTPALSQIMESSLANAI